MDIKGKKVTVKNSSKVLPVGSKFFEEPSARLVISSSQDNGSFWFIHVDLIDYVKASSLAAGRSPEQADSEARGAYIKALVGFDIDEFEAELFLDAYREVAAPGGNPYALES